LQRAEAAFRDARLAFGRSTGRGAREAEDLANLFRLEMDKLRNKYESVRHGNWQQGSQQLDEALEKLKALARRQQQEIERLERRAALAADAPPGGGSQRALAAELEDMVRRLERLSREQMTPELENLTRQAKAAAEAMRRASAIDGNGVADARAALDRLKNIQRLADRRPRQQLQRGIGKASRRTERLAEEHKGIGAGMEARPEDAASRKKSTSKLQSRKLRMAEEVRDLESDLRRLARDAGKGKAEASRALRGAADTIDKDDLANTIERSAAAMDGPGKDASQRMQAAIGESLERVGEALADAAKSVDQSRERERARGLAQLRELVEGLESLEGGKLQRSRAGRAKAGGARSAWGTADGQSSMGRDVDAADLTDPADLRRDFAQRRGMLERLAEVMSSDEHGARDIGRLLGEMREIEQDSAFDDLQRQRQLIAGLKELEMRLHGDWDEEETRALLLPAQDSVPSQYRLQVDEYFRGLSRADSSARVAD
jgi:hypothetical protein